LALVAGASLLLALGSAASAHPGNGGGGGLGGGSSGGDPSSPPGFSSGGDHNGFDQSTAADGTVSSSPRGWDNGKADWKTNTETTDVTPQPDSALAPGFARY
jgi:hypothetical protein